MDALDTSIELLLKSAIASHRAGDFAAARQSYEEILKLNPDHAEAAFSFGLLEFATDRHEAALASIQCALMASPGTMRYHIGSGQVLAALKRYPEAANAYETVLTAEPGLADVQLALGLVREALGDWDRAVLAYQSAIESCPGFVDALNNLGNCHFRRNQFAQAEDIYRRALALRPTDGRAMANLAVVLLTLGRVDQAIDQLQVVIRVEPAVAMHYINLGAALCKRRQFADAVSTLGKALELDAGLPEAFYNLGNAFHGLGRSADAAAHYRRAIELKPDYADALNNLGNLYVESGDFTHAAAAFEAAIRVRPDSAVAFNNAGCLQRTLGKLAEAEETLRRGLAVDSKLSATFTNLGNVLKDAGVLDEAIDCYRKALSVEPGNALAHSNLAYSLSFSETDGQTILDECRRWDARHGVPLRPDIAPAIHEPSIGRRLRIGYVSGDFRDHCQSLFTIPLLSSHDHNSFEIYCYSSVERPDDFTRRISQFADVWRDVRRLSDAELYRMIVNDRIDILVDLAMHMAGGRPGLFARKPAPIQLAWLAYPGTTGLSAIDHVLSDPWLAPPSDDRFYSERVIRLPETFWCYDPLICEPAVNALPALVDGYVTFGCLNAACKLSDRTLLLWSGIFQRIGNARLILMAAPGPRRRQLSDRLAASGIPADRVVFQSFLPRSAYLRTYHQIDLGLDTLPYNGHTTSLDSFWMGVPVVSRIGTTAGGRAGLSQLSNLKLTELCAQTDEAFVEITVALAKDLPRLSELRRTLRERMEHSSLMDRVRFTKNMESAFREMWGNAIGAFTANSLDTG